MTDNRVFSSRSIYIYHHVLGRLLSPRRAPAVYGTFIQFQIG